MMSTQKTTSRQAKLPQKQQPKPKEADPNGAGGAYRILKGQKTDR